jgi:hypothetical protein
MRIREAALAEDDSGMLLLLETYTLVRAKPGAPRMPGK